MSDEQRADITAGQYLAGVVGLAMLRNWYVDGDTNETRLAELRSIVDNLAEFPNSLVLNPTERELIDGYAEWAPQYDGPNPLIEAEEPVVLPILDQLVRPGMHALDAACGTGRNASHLADRGCTVAGIDQSAAMLNIARERVPAATFDEGSIEALPYVDDSFDIATISLALCHLDDPTVAIGELARVLRPGGKLVIADPHPMGQVIGGQAFYGGIVPGQPMTWVRNNYHGAATWLSAFAAANLAVDRCIEQQFSPEQIASGPAYMMLPDAATAAIEGLASLWIWVVSAPTGNS